MSRTYRCRHLPALPGTAKKIVEGCGRYGWGDKDKYIEGILTSLGMPRPSYPHSVIVKSKGATHKVWHPPEYYKPTKVSSSSGFLFDWMNVKKPSYYTVEPGVLRPSAVWAVYERNREALRSSIVWPVDSWHPWQRRYSVGGRKKYYRTLGNRLDRRQTKAILRSSIIDEDWEGFFPNRRTNFDWWDIY